MASNPIKPILFEDAQTLKWLPRSYPKLILATIFLFPTLAIAQDQKTDQTQDPPITQDHSTKQQDIREQKEKSPNFIDWYQTYIASRVAISGYRRIGYHFHEVSGDRDAFEFGNYGGQSAGRFTDFGYLRLEGDKLFNAWSFELNLQDSRFVDPQAQTYRVGYDRGPWKFGFGDIVASLPNTNRFARLNKRIEGVTAQYKSGNLDVRALTSQAKGQARTVTIQGTNSAGPYFLQSSQIIRNSERVEVDGVPQTFGQDYVIDYDLGSITFVNRQTLDAKIISPTSTIVATYESFGFNGSAGRIEGAGLTYDMGSAGQIGFTALRQVTGAGGALSTRIERFQGFGAPSTPYFLQFEPLLSEPIVIRVDGALQTANVDYFFDANNSAIFYFNRFMPATQTIDVVYTPKPTANVQGDRETLGIDYRLPFSNDRGRINASLAQGRLYNSPSPSSGIAKGLQATYSNGKYTLNASARDIPQDYVSVETTSFSRNERAHDLNAIVQIDQENRLSFNHLNSSIASRSVSGTTINTNRTRFVRSGLTYSLTPPNTKAFPLELSLSRFETTSPSNNNKVDTAAISTSRQFGRLSTRFSLENQRVSGTSAADLLSTVLRLGYNAGSVWSFGAEYGLSQVKTDSGAGTGRDISLTALFRPNDEVAVTLAHSDNSSGDVNRLSDFNSGFGTGFNGNGFTSGAIDPTLNLSTSGRRTSALISWLPGDRLSMSASGIIYRTQGNISSNSETKSFGVNADYDLGQSHRIGLSLNRSETSFIGSPTNSSATTGDFTIVGTAGTKLNYRASITALLSGGNSQFAQDAFTYELFLDYALGPRQSLGFTFNSSNTQGYFPQEDYDTSLTYSYQIWKALALNFSYRFRDVKNLDDQFNSGAYRSSGFDVVLSYNFFR